MCIVCGMQLNPPDLQVSVSLRYIRTQRPYPAKGGKTYFEQCMRAKGAEIEPGTQAHILCEPAQAKRMSRFHKSRFLWKFFGKNVAPPRLSPERRHTFCASLHSRNACPHVTRDIRRATLYGHLQEKCRRPDWAQNADTLFVRACAVETHVKISQEPLYTEIYRKNAEAQSEHPDQAPAFTPTISYRKKPSVWTHCLGKKLEDLVSWETFLKNLENLKISRSPVGLHLFGPLDTLDPPWVTHQRLDLGLDQGLGPASSRSSFSPWNSCLTHGWFQGFDGQNIGKSMSKIDHQNITEYPSWMLTYVNHRKLASWI